MLRVSGFLKEISVPSRIANLQIAHGDLPLLQLIPRCCVVGSAE